MKTIVKMLLVIFVLSALCVRSFAYVKIDASDDGVEWQNAAYKILIDETHDNNVNYAYMKSLIDSNNFDIYFLIQSSDFKSSSNENVGFILTLLNDVTITVTSQDVTVEGNAGDYSVESKIKTIDNDGVICELRVGVKKGIPQNVSGTVSCIDGMGVKSNYYPFTLNNPNIEVDSTTIKYINNVTEKTTKEKTTRYREADKTTHKNSEATTLKKTDNTTKKKDNKTVVYFYEKEIIVSQVYETQDTQAQSIVNLNNPEEITTACVLTNSSDSFQQSEGMKIQKVICAVGGALLIALGAWAGISTKKNNDFNNDKSDK